MVAIVNCSLPETGAGMSALALAMAVMLAGLIVWRTPRAHRMHMMLAIALPAAMLTMTHRASAAASDDCVTAPTEAAAPATTATTATTMAPTTTTVPATTTTAAPTTTVAGPFAVTVTFTNGEDDAVFSGAGWTAGTTTSPNGYTKVYTGMVSRSNPTVSIAFTTVSTEMTFTKGTLTGATCTDGASTPLDNSGSGYQSLVSPVSCTLTGTFAITLYGQAT